MCCVFVLVHGAVRVSVDSVLMSQDLVSVCGLTSCHLRSLDSSALGSGFMCASWSGITGRLTLGPIRSFWHVSQKLEGMCSQVPGRVSELNGRGYSDAGKSESSNDRVRG